MIFQSMKFSTILRISDQINNSKNQNEKKTRLQKHKINTPKLQQKDSEIQNQI